MIDVAGALRFSEVVSDWIAAHHPTELRGTPNAELAGRFFAISLDHRAAILLLVERGALTSAFALSRSVYESYVKGFWAQHCSVEELKEIHRRGALPKLDRIIRRLDELSAQSGSFSATKKVGWDVFSEFAHSGVPLLTKWVDEGNGIGAAFPPSEVVAILYFIDLYGVLACYGMAELADWPIDAHHSMANAVNREGRLRHSHSSKAR